MDLKRNSVGLGNTPALIVVDMINGFTDKTCPLGSDSETVVAANVTLLKAFRLRGHPVFFTTVVYQREDQAVVFRKRLPALNVLTPGAHWVEIDPALERQGGEAIIEKQWASAFFKTNLDAQLRAKAVDSLVVSGLTTSGCVRATVVDGLQYDYPVTVAREAVGDRNRKAHESNLFDMQAKYADVISLDELMLLL